MRAMDREIDRDRVEYYKKATDWEWNCKKAFWIRANDKETKTLREMIILFPKILSNLKRKCGQYQLIKRIYLNKGHKRNIW